MTAYIWKLDGWVCVQCPVRFFVSGLEQTLSRWEVATVYHSHVTFITDLTWEISRCNFKEHVNYYARNFQTQEPSKWKSACCTNMSQNWILATFCLTWLVLNPPPHFATGTCRSANLLALFNSSKITSLQALEISKQDQWNLMFQNPSGTQHCLK